MIVPLATVALFGAVAGATPESDTNAVIAQALNDAQSSSSLLLAPSNAGHDGEFFITDGRGDFRLGINGQMQTRWLASWRDDEGGVDPFTTGFQIRRLKLVFNGHLFDDSLRFKITNESGRAGGGMRISDAFIEKRFENGLSIKAGQFKLPFTREYLDSSRRLLAVDRSLVDSAFRLSRSQGVQLELRSDIWRGWVAFSDGRRSDNIDFGSDATDWAITGRAEWMAYGSFGVFRSQGGAIDSEPSLRIGGAIHAEERGASVFGPGGRLVTWTGDVAGAGPGWIGLATLTGRENSQTTGTVRTDWGIAAQLGFWATDEVVPFVRWELFIPDRDRTARSKTNVLTVGANWHLHGNALKLTIDGVWLIDGAGSSDLIGPNTGAGVLAPGLGDTQFVLRAQVQLLF